MTLEWTAECAFEPVQRAVKDGHLPGAVLGLITADGTRTVRWTGSATLVPAPEPIDRGTVFDLASLTKVLVTTPAILKLVERGQADLDDPLARHLPDLCHYAPDAPVRRMTLRDCLAHRTGLPATEPIYAWGGDPNALRALILQRHWPVGEPVYSDLDFILLGFVLERRLKTRFVELPIDLAPGGALTFWPEPDRCAATEDCPWRGRVLRGEVHDENAWALAGAGHAGLFGTVDGVLDAALAILEGRVLSPAALEEMARPHVRRFALGWEHRHEGWAGGSLCSSRTIGHTGFTGVGLWIDQARGLAWTLLTNRLHPSRHGPFEMVHLRRAVGNVVAAGGWDED